MTVAKVQLLRRQAHERLESFCVVEKIAIDVESLVIEVMVLELSN